MRLLASRARCIGTYLSPDLPYRELLLLCMLAFCSSPVRANAQLSPDASLPDAPTAVTASTTSTLWVSPDAIIATSPAPAPPGPRISTSRPAHNSGPDEPATLPRDCPYDRTHSRLCRPHIRQLVISTAVFNAFQNAGNLYTGYWYR